MRHRRSRWRLLAWGHGSARWAAVRPAKRERTADVLGRGRAPAGRGLRRRHRPRRVREGRRVLRAAVADGGAEALHGAGLEADEDRQDGDHRDARSCASTSTWRPARCRFSTPPGGRSPPSGRADGRSTPATVMGEATHHVRQQWQPNDGERSTASASTSRGCSTSRAPTSSCASTTARSSSRCWCRAAATGSCGTTRRSRASAISASRAAAWDDRPLRAGGDAGDVAPARGPRLDADA